VQLPSANQTQELIYRLFFSAGPAIINLGRAVAGGANTTVLQYAIWLASMVAGGLAARVV
jgi:hypothetical protein